MYCLLNNGFTYYLFAIAKFNEGFFIYDIFSIIEVACFLFFIKQIIKNKKIAKYLPLIFFTFLGFNIIDYFFLRQPESFNSMASGVEAILIIISCLYYFYEQLREETSTLLIYTTHTFWIVIAFLIFFAGTFFLYIYTENISIDDKAFIKQYIIINSVFYLLKNILFSIAMLMKPEPESPSDFPSEHFVSDWNHTRSFKNVN